MLLDIEGGKMEQQNTRRELVEYSLSDYKNDVEAEYKDLLLKMLMNKDNAKGRKLIGTAAGQALGAARKRLAAGYFYSLLNRLKKSPDITITVHVALELGQQLVERKFRAKDIVWRAGTPDRKATQKVNVLKEVEKIRALDFIAKDLKKMEVDLKRAEEYKKAKYKEYKEALKTSLAE